jgi:hypothetical protein
MLFGPRGKNLTCFCPQGEKFDIQGEKFNMILYAYFQLKLAWGKNLTCFGASGGKI